MRRGWKCCVAAGSVVVLLSACGSSSSDSAQLVGSGPGDEVTDVEEPTVEVTGPEVSTQVENAGFAVQLPGVASGGPTAQFDMVGLDACAQVGLGALETSEVAVTIDRLEVPAGVSVLEGGCGGVRPCLNGVGVTAGQATCSVPLRTTGALADDAVLRVTGATVLCPDRASCEEAVAEVRGEGAIGLAARGSVSSRAPDPDDGESEGVSDDESLAEPFGDERTERSGVPEAELPDGDGGTGASGESGPEQ